MPEWVTRAPASGLCIHDRNPSVRRDALMCYRCVFIRGHRGKRTRHLVFSGIIQVQYYRTSCVSSTCAIAGFPSFPPNRLASESRRVRRFSHLRLTLGSLEITNSIIFEPSSLADEPTHNLWATFRSFVSTTLSSFGTTDRRARFVNRDRSCCIVQVTALDD